MKPALLLHCLAPWVALCLGALAVAAQSTGSIQGQVVGSGGEPLVGATVTLVGTEQRTMTRADGRFLLGAVPVGERSIRVDLLGHRTVTVLRLTVANGRAAEVKVTLEPAPVAVRGIEVQAERVRLIEPEVSQSHQVLTGRELRELPVDRLDQVLELTTGVSDGHFRGGRVGQETYVVDGLSVKNPLEASAKGAALEFSPTALEEMEVITGGLAAEYGSALSGAVSYATRRGSRERWEGQATLRGDGFGGLGAGFNAASVSLGGPVRPLGPGTTIFGDLLVQGMEDADPRQGGLSCLRPDDVSGELARRLADLRASAPSLYCPYAPSVLPHDGGDKLIGFVRLDRPLGGGFSLTGTVLGNRLQRQLYAPELKYSGASQLGQRTYGSLGTLALDWTRNRNNFTQHVVWRGAVLRLDRYLGALESASMQRSSVAGFGLAPYRFLGESFTRSSPYAQLQAGTGVPGYEHEGGSAGSPFGPAATGIFFTTGTPQLANWTRTEAVGGDLLGELFAPGSIMLRGGASGRLYRVQSYERNSAADLGSAFNYARFFPATFSVYVSGQWGNPDSLSMQIGLRAEGFRSGIQFRAHRANFLEVGLDPSWNLAFTGRCGIALPLPGSQGRTVARINYTRLAQPPDFQYFLDTTVGDSLRTAIRRQGNPQLSFEQGYAYEAGVTRLLNRHLSAGVTAFRKMLEELVSGDFLFNSASEPTFSLADYGRVEGVELTVHGRWPLLTVRAGYAYQKALGVSSTAFGSTATSIQDLRHTYPLAFDQRHAFNFTALAGRAAGSGQRWGAVLSGTARSGYPLDPTAASASTGTPSYLPWTENLSGRFTFDLGRFGCRRCRYEATVDGRNLLGLRNVVALRRETGRLGPDSAAFAAVEQAAPIPYASIPFESPAYSALIDLNHDGVVTQDEYRVARFAAAVDRFDPSLYYGEARQLRLGVRMSF